MTLEERSKLIQDVDLQDVWNVFVFFWNLWNDYLNDTEDSLSKWMGETLEMTKQILENDGDSSV